MRKRRSQLWLIWSRASSMKTDGRAGERVFDGVGVAPGIAIGLALSIEWCDLLVPEYTLGADQVEAEKTRFADAVARAQKQLRKLKTKCAGIPGAAGEELGYLLDAHLQMLTGSRLVRGVVQHIERDRLNAEAAVREVIADIAKGFARMSDAYLTARVDDIREAGNRLIRQLAKTLARYRRLRAAWLRENSRLAGFVALPSVTRDGHHVVLHANLELPREVKGVLAAGAAGIGLLRTEFLFMNRDDLPDEDEQYAMLRDIIEGMGDRPVTIRTLDVGGEKLAYSLGPHIGQSTNPAFGLRAIRLSLREPKLLEAQLAAILRAGCPGNGRVRVPMISTVGEVRRVREIMEQVIRRLKRRGVKIAEPLPPVGVMIEIPGAALSADALALAADFFAIGTNDLTMYTLAIDRADDQVAHLYNPLHPARLGLVQFAIEAALRAHIPVSVCGEIAGDPRYTALLLGLGVRELSMAPASIGRVKRRVRHLELVAATQRARAIMEQWDEARISVLLDEFNTDAAHRA